MIIKCEECGSQFDLDESLIKESGSKVKCSVCKNIFKVYPPEPEPFEESSDDNFINEALEETVALDSPPSFEEMESTEGDLDLTNEFDRAFEDALEKDIQEVHLDDISDFDEEGEPTEAIDDSPETLFERTDADVAHPYIPASGRGRVGPRNLLLVLLIILALIIGALFVFFIAPDILPDSLSSLKPVKKEEIADTGIRKLAFEGVNGDFFQSEKIGQLFIIEGSVINNNPKSRSFILLKGTILDDTGSPVIKKLVYAGNTFDEAQLRDMSLEEIDKGQKNQGGKEDINVDVSPGSAVPFMIVFENLPENISEFVVEAVSSSPGK